MTETKQTLEKSFTITRIFDAPRAEIWRAWTDPDEAATWWHPRGVETPRDSVEIDARPGGTYRYTMIAPDGSTYDVRRLPRGRRARAAQLHVGRPGRHVGRRAPDHRDPRGPR